MVKVPTDEEEEPGQSVDLINETEILLATNTTTTTDSATTCSGPPVVPKECSLTTLEGLKRPQRVHPCSTPVVAEKVPQLEEQEEEDNGGADKSSIRMATDESVVVNSEDASSSSLEVAVDSISNNAEQATVAPAPAELPVEEVFSVEESTAATVTAPPEESSGIKVHAAPAVLPTSNSSTPQQLPQMLPNTVIAVVQPTTRTNSNYMRINANPAAAVKTREQPTHYVAVPAQRVVVAPTTGRPTHQTSSTSVQQQQQQTTNAKQKYPNQSSALSSSARRVMSQVTYAPGITIHHCQPPGGTPAPANSVTMAAQQVWPIVDPVFNFGPGFEPPSRPYCPTHEPQTQEHVVMFHVHPGVSVSFQIGGNQEIVRGPVTVPMVSQSGSPPIPMPVQVPPGHLMQQVVDENGTLRHVILSPAQTHQIHNQGGVQHHIHGPFYPTNGTATQYFSAIPTSAFTGTLPPPPPPQHTQAGPPPGGYNTGPGGGQGGGGGATTYTLIPQPQMHSQQHSPSPPNGGGDRNQVAYHNKDERLQQIHKKLQKKLEKRDLTAGPAMASSSPRKGTSSSSLSSSSGLAATTMTTTVTSNGEMIMPGGVGTIPVSMVVGNKRNNVHKQIHGNMNHMQQQQQQQFHPHQHHHHPHQPQQHHHHHPHNNHVRIVLNNNNNNNSNIAGPGGRKVVTVSKTTTTTTSHGTNAAAAAKKRGLNGGGGPGNGNFESSAEDGEEEGTSSVPEDEEYQLMDVEDEVDGEVEHQSCGMMMTAANGEFEGADATTESNNNSQASHPLGSVEEEVQHIKEQLSLVAGPKVSEILSRSALLQWVPPPNSETLQFNPADLFYEILLSDSAKYAKYKSIFKGQSLSCRIQDLKPGVEYSVCLRVHYQSVQGLESLTTIFNTVPCAPDAPMPPKLLTRSKNTLQLRWNGTTENGSHIQQYVLEYDCGRGMEFVEVCRTKGKQYTLTKLVPSTNYRFRLYAINEYGKSDYSRIESFQTACPPPSQPLPPTMPYATSSSLRLDWMRRGSDKEFVLQMATLTDNGHGYLPCYTGPDTHYECTNLPRATGFLFRLKATNDSGASPWSPDVYYYTLPDPPGRPAKPQVKGKIHATNFRIKWDPPVDCGGAPIKLYELQISSGAAYEQVYVGPDTETQFVHLSPATTYQVRVLCEGPGGHSPFSEPCTVTTEPVTPCAPQRPQLFDLGVYSAAIRWGPPSDNGGSPVLEFEVELEGKLSRVNQQTTTSVETTTTTTTTTSDTPKTTLVYRGKELSCDLKQLLPGEQYKVQVRACNRMGAGAWSEVFAFSSNAAPPNTPQAPQLTVVSATEMRAEWPEPSGNGSPVEKYILEMSSATDQSPDDFAVVYSGTMLCHELTNLQPFSRFFFKVCAVNAAGTSNYSEIVEAHTPAGPPAMPVIDELLVTADSVTLRWTKPPTNGAEITEYYLMYRANQAAAFKEVCVRGATPDGDGNLEHTIVGLEAECSYKIKMRAVNKAGVSPCSSASKVVTLPHPPTPPEIECVAVAHNSLKLKWGEGRNVDFLYYYVEMSHSRSREYANVYSGPNFTCKVTKLAERTAYKFRIRAKADRAGMGAFSKDFLFQTAAALPASIKAPRVFYPAASVDAVETKTKAEEDKNDVNVEWQHSKNTFQDVVEYILQVRRQVDAGQEYTQVYRGPETKHVVESLDCGVEYSMRVCPVRIMRKTPIGNGKRSRENRISDSESTFGDSRSSSCSQKDGAGDQDVVAEETTTSKECDMVELMGQWSPVLSYVVQPHEQNHSEVHHHPHNDAHHHHPHNHIHHPHNHIHHPHSHHSHHRSSHNNNIQAGGAQQAVVAAGAVSEGKSDSEALLMGGAAGGVLGKLRSLYSSDAAKAPIFTFAFMMVAFGVGIAFDCFIRN